jgi:ribosome-associated protein
VSAKQKAHTLSKSPKKSGKKSGKDTAAADKLLADIVESLEDHKAEDVIVINLRGKSDIADYMVIASGQSGRQVSTMADRLVLVVKNHGVVGAVPEGKGQSDWVLLDGGDVIVHLFRPEVREFYNLEKMWNVDFPDPQEPATV